MSVVDLQFGDFGLDVDSIGRCIEPACNSFFAKELPKAKVTASLKYELLKRSHFCSQSVINRSHCAMKEGGE